MREIKFRAWNSADGGVMLEVGDAYGTTHPLDCCGYFVEGQPVTLMQYTGLKDKNGKEIYEGDLLSCNFNQTHEVIWESYFAQYKTKHLASGVVSDVYKDVLEEEFEIIGNIYENKELLEK